MPAQTGEATGNLDIEAATRRECRRGTSVAITTVSGLSHIFESLMPSGCSAQVAYSYMQGENTRSGRLEAKVSICRCVNQANMPGLHFLLDVRRWRTRTCRAKTRGRGAWTTTPSCPRCALTRSHVENAGALPLLVGLHTLRRCRSVLCIPSPGSCGTAPN